MSNILKAKVTITGVRPLLLHHFGPDALPLEKQERTGVAGNDPEEWKKTILTTKDGQFFLDPSYVFGCLRDGAKYTKKNRGSIQPLMCATLQILTDRILIDRWIPNDIEDRINETDQDVYLDVRGVRNPSTRARNVRYRLALAPGWKTSFEIMWDKTIVSRNEMEAVINDAGRYVGLADARTIGFGRFKVESIEVSELNAKEKVS